MVYRLFVQVRPAQGGRVLVSTGICPVPGHTLPPGHVSSFGNMATAVRFYRSRKKALAAAGVVVSRFAAGPAVRPRSGQLLLAF
jgi:hypothetical protein